MSHTLRFMVGMLLLTVCFAVQAGDKESARINGVADYLIDRAKENYFYIFEKKIRDNESLKCYFPTTYSYVAEGDLKLLLTSRGVWGSAIQKDLDTLVAGAVAREINASVDFRDHAMAATNFYAEMVQYLSLSIGGVPYRLDFIPNDASDEVRKVINGFYTNFNNVRDLMLATGARLALLKDKCEPSPLSTAELTGAIEDLQVAVQGLAQWLAHIEKYKDDLTLDLDGIERDCARDASAKVCGFRDKITSEWVPAVKQTLDQPVIKAVAGAAFLVKYVRDIQKADSNTAKVLVAIKGLKESGLDKTIELDKFKHHILFFAQISDATEAEEVSALLSDYTLPAVSFFVKREKNTSHILVSAYLGYGYGEVVNESKAGDDNKSGVMAPIGLEYSYGTKGEGAWSFLLAPFDFGYPVSLKLHGITEDVDFDEIIAPGAYLAYGVPEYPLNLGIAYQQGRKVGTGNDAENRVFFFVAFDMPLLTLY